MLRVPAHPYTHQNTSLPENVPVSPAKFTRKMLSSVGQSATSRRPFKAVPTDYSGWTDHIANPDNQLIAGASPDGTSVGSDGLSTSSTVTTVMFTGDVLTLIAGTASPATILASPVAMSSALPTDTFSSLTVSTSPPSSIVSEGNAGAPDSPSIILSTPVSTSTGDIKSSVTTVSTPNAVTSPPIPQPNSSGHRNSTCDTDYGCAAVEGKAENHEGIIAGAILGVVAVIILMLTAFVLRRSRYKRAAKRLHPDNDSAWHKISRSDGATSMATDAEVTEECFPNKHGDRDLGEPGPAFDFGEIGAKTTKHPDTKSPLLNDKKSSGSAWSNNLCDPFHSATDSNHENRNPRSNIGIALTRYSTTDSMAPLSRPFFLTNCPIIPPILRENVPQGHKRHSSMSAQSDASNRLENEVVYIGKARTARRHSLTPRVINIVAGGSSIDKISFGSNNGDSISATKNDLNRDSTCSRSMSPNKLLSGYTSFVNGLSNHLHKNSFNRTSNQSDGINRSSTTKTTVIDTLKYPVIPKRGRSLKRTANHHISYPPTSYPNLGKTMSEVKRTIREKGDSAFASSDDLWDKARKDARSDGSPAGLPSSVTIARGGRGK